MAKTEFKMVGLKEMLRELKAVERETDKAVLQGLNRKAEKIMRVSKQKFVPVDEGVLRSSGVAQKAEKSGRKWIVRFSFGGAASAYALAIHEHPSRYSPPSWKGKDVEFHPDGRGPKYLTNAINLELPTFKTDIGNAVKERLARRRARTAA